MSCRSQIQTIMGEDRLSELLKPERNLENPGSRMPTNLLSYSRYCRIKCGVSSEISIATQDTRNVDLMNARFAARVVGEEVEGLCEKAS